jgi:nucleoside-diphosphate-sugar epimerase
MKQILLCGQRSFAAQGLLNLLESQGHSVDCFSRGPTGRAGRVVTGAVKEMNTNQNFLQSYDTVINYIVLHQESIESNLEYIHSLLQFCEARGVKHLIHISSCSAYKNNVRLVTEDSPIETDRKRKGPYAAIKAAQEAYIIKHAPKCLKVSYIRPGLILANGMGGYIGGIGIRLPWNSIIGLGSAKSQIPLVTRDAVNQTIAFLINNPPKGYSETLLIADGSSPTRRQYLENCCEVLGVGTGVIFFPVFLWLCTGFFAELMSRVIGKGHFGIWGKIRSICRYQQFDAKKTERRVSISFSGDWKTEMKKEFDFQDINFDIPDDMSLHKTSAKKITFIGFGRIVKQRHLPSLEKLGFDGTIEAYDLQEHKDNYGQWIQDINCSNLRSSDLFVVATPGPMHVNALAILKNAQGPILMEKPLGYNIDELNRWIEFATIRKDPIYVCHDRRYKVNVMAMIHFLKKYNPGRLHNVSVVFQSAPVNKETTPWLRAERQVRTLLMDYGLHHIDLACMFGKGSPLLKDCRYKLNGRGETTLIEGEALFDNYSIHFLLRQGINQRRTTLIYTFQNYSVTLGFTPDIFVPHMADENFGLSFLSAWASLKSTYVKIFDKILGRESELSHAYAYQIAMSGDWAAPLTIEKLRPVYELLFQISDRVYER